MKNINPKFAEKIKSKKNKLKLLAKYQLGLNQILKPVIFFAISFILEIVSFAIFNFKTPSGSTQLLPQYLFLNIGFWLIICAIMLCTHKNWFSNVIFYIGLFAELGMFIINTTLKNDFGYLFTFDMLDLIDEMTATIDISFINYKLIGIAILGTIIVIAIPLIIDKLLHRKTITIKKISKSIFCLLFFLITSTLGVGSYAVQTALLKTSKANSEISDDKYLYENMQITDLAYQKFGSCGFYLKNFFNTLFPNNSISKKEQDDIIKNYTLSTTNRDTSATLYGENLIVIMLESFEWFAIDPYNTPNLWALKTGTASSNISRKAMVFTNYNSNNKTNLSENICMLGYMPSVCNFNTKSIKEYSTRYSLPNLLKAEGYTSAFFHNWDKEFYARGTTNKNIGFDKIYTIDDFKQENKSTKFNFYNLETDFANQFMEQIAPTDGNPFISFYTTISTHGLYNIVNPRFEKYFKEYDKNLEDMKSWFFNEGYHYPTEPEMQAILKEYKSAAMDTDEMIGNLFSHLKEHDILDETTVVLYSDHQALYNDLANEIKSTNKSDFSSQESYVVPLMIYSERLEPSTIDTFCSTYDLYPTLCNLYGLPYNKINAQGKDIFSSEISETVYMSHLTGFYNDKCYSKNMQYITKYTNSTDSDVQNFKDNVCKLLEKQRLLNIIYNTHKIY